MERFIIKGLCEKCGELLGNLKPIAHLSNYAGWPSNTMRVDDPVLYHVSDHIETTRMKCKDG